MCARTNRLIQPVFPETHRPSLDPGLRERLSMCSIRRGRRHDVVPTCLWNHLRKIWQRRAGELQGFSEGISLGSCKSLGAGKGVTPTARGGEGFPAQAHPGLGRPGLRQLLQRPLLLPGSGQPFRIGLHRTLSSGDPGRGQRPTARLDL